MRGSKIFVIQREPTIGFCLIANCPVFSRAWFYGNELFRFFVAIVVNHLMK